MCNPFDWPVSVRYLLKLYAHGILIYCAGKFRIDPLLTSQSETIHLFSGCGWEALISAGVYVTEGIAKSTSATN